MGGTRLRPVGEGGHIIEDEGVPLAQQPALNFLGAGVVAADAPGKTNVTIPGGGGSGGGLWELLAESSLVGLSTKTLTINASTSSFIKFMIIVNAQFSAAQDNYEIVITDDQGGLDQVGYKSIASGALLIDDRGGGLEIQLENPVVMAQDEPTACEVIIYGHVDVNGKLIGYVKWTGQGPGNETYHVSDGIIVEPGAGTSTIGDIIVKSATGTVFATGSFVRIYQMNVATGGAGGNGHIIEDEGTPLTQRANLNFKGAGVAVTDNDPDTDVTISGGASNFPDSVPFKDDDSLREALDFDEFNLNTGIGIGNVAFLIQEGWTISNSGVVSITEGSAFNGGLGLETAGLAGNGVAMIREAHALSADRNFVYKSIITLQSTITDTLVLVGVVDDPGAFSAVAATCEANITAGLWFRYSQDDSPNWQARVKSGAIDSTTDTGVAATLGINAFEDFHITYVVATRVVTFFINGVQVHQETLAAKLGSAVAGLFQVISQFSSTFPSLSCQAYYTRAARI